MATDEDVLKDALDQFEQSENLDREQRKLAIEDMKFIHAEGGQWTEEAASKRGDRPRFTIDRISGAIDQVIGNQRQTRSGPKVTPQKDGDEKGAEVRKGMIRSIEELSNAGTIYDNAFMEQLISGYGGWRIYTTYEGDTTFDQVIRMGPVRSAASSLYFDTEADEYTKEDSMWAFLVWTTSIDRFKVAFPDATISDFAGEIYNTEQRRDWFQENGIRLAEYWTREEYQKKLGLMSDGRILDLEEEEDVIDELKASDIKVLDERKVKSYKCYRRIMNGAEILQDKELWPGKYIPLIPVYGKLAVIQDGHYVRGMVRKAKDAQRIYNYATSAAIEAAALTPKNPYFITPTELGKYQEQWRTFNTKNPVFMLFDPDTAMGGQRPTKDQPAPIQPALIQSIQQAAEDIHSTTGLEPASLGNVPELKSGKAILAQQAMGDRGSYIYQSNFEKSMAHGYKVIGDLLPRIYDTERTEKILGNEDQVEEIVINERQKNPLGELVIDRETGKEVIVNDLTVGNYSYGVSTGPAQHTKREETVNQLMEIAQTDEQFRAVMYDLIIKNMDLNHKDEIVKRIRKKQIEAGLVEPTEDEIREFKLDQPKEPDPVQIELVKNLQAQTEKLHIDTERVISEIQNREADTEQKIMNTLKASTEAFKTAMEGILAKHEAGFQVTADEAQMVRGQAAVIEEVQTDVIENQQIAGSLPMNAKQPQGMPSNQPMQPEQSRGNTPIVTIPGPNEI